MKTEHTPEPWVAITGGIFDPEVIITTQCRLGESLDEICGMDIEFTGQHGIEQKANARRIVACVNACAGISIESLEAGGIGSILSLGLEEQKRGDMAERERDELLNALKEVKSVGHGVIPKHVWMTVEEAIASVKENEK